MPPPSGAAGPAPVVVRAADPGDLPDLVVLLAAGTLAPEQEDPGDPGAYRAALDEIMATPGSEILVAETAGEVVGLCQLVVFRHLQAQGGRCAEVESLHVRADRRSTGVGGVLLEAAVARAAAAGCYRVQLTSNRARVDAHRFYLRHGFVASHEGFKRLLR